MERSKLFALYLAFFTLFTVSTAHARASIDTSIAKLQSIDKVTARTLTFEVNVGSTVKFGSLYIKLQASRLIIGSALKGFEFRERFCVQHLSTPIGAAH